MPRLPLPLAALLVCSLVALAGCGAHRMAPVAPRPAAGLTPAVEDPDAGLIGVVPGFSPSAYRVIVVEAFTVDTREIKDEEDARLAKDMAAYLHAQLVRRLQAASVFSRVVDGSVATTAPAGERALRLSGEITRLTEGSQALRYFVGFGAGAAKAQIETRFVDAGSRKTVLITADRRAAGMGIFGGDGRQFLTESMDQMADGLVKLLGRSASGAPKPYRPPYRPAR
jgi:hypothetical protein